MGGLRRKRLGISHTIWKMMAMILFKDIKTATENAFAKDEFFELITGRNGYCLKVADAPVDVPTDWTRIVSNGIFAVYEGAKDPEVKIKYEEAIVRAVNGSLYDMWCAINVIFFQKDNENLKKAPFCISQDVTNGLLAKIHLHKDKMEEIRPYGESGLNMYQDVLRLNAIFVNNWGYSFLM